MRTDSYEMHPIGSFISTYVIVLFSLFAFRTLKVYADTGWQKALIFTAVTLLGTVLVSLIQQGTATISPAGIAEKSWKKKCKTPWNGIIQVFSYAYDGKPALIFVKANGSKLHEEDRMIRFYLRNIGKLIILPDEKITRQFVADYYGPLDYDFLNSDTKKK
jgi:hypothetical protein